jgi:hypothetical protein
MEEGRPDSDLRALRTAREIIPNLFGAVRRWLALLTSPYFHASLALTVVLTHLWIGDAGAKIWPSLSTSVLPSLMGFSVAGMAIFLAFSHPEAMKAITEEGEPQSYFMTAVAQFFHFIFVQAIALLLGVIGQHLSSDYLSAFGVFFLIYSIFVGVAMAMTLLLTAQIVNAASSVRSGGEDASEED